MRNRAPNKGQPPVTLHHADVLNLVDVQEKNYEKCVKEFVLDQCIDFIFESFSRTLKLLSFARISRWKAVQLVFRCMIDHFWLHFVHSYRHAASD